MSAFKSYEVQKLSSLFLIEWFFLSGTTLDLQVLHVLNLDIYVLYIIIYMAYRFDKQVHYHLEDSNLSLKDEY